MKIDDADRQLTPSPLLPWAVIIVVALALVLIGMGYVLSQGR